MQHTAKNSDGYEALRAARRQTRSLKRASVGLLVLDIIGVIVLLMWLNWREFL